ncbi:MAG TPA: TraR/DksA C4-type zinc finger protein [Candidatus Paceibacterota bacterium]
MLNDTEIATFKQKLEEERKQIELEIKNLEKSPDFGSDVTELNDEEADEAEEFSTNVGIADTLKIRLREIEDALKKVRERTYGKCEKCGKDIEPDLLHVNPESRLCKQCKLEE